MTIAGGSSTGFAVDGGGVGWLIEPNLATARYSEGGFPAPWLLGNWGAADVLSLQRMDNCRQVVAHEVEHRAEEVVARMALRIVFLGGMQSGFSRR